MRNSSKTFLRYRLITARCFCVVRRSLTPMGMRNLMSRSSNSSCLWYEPFDIGRVPAHGGHGTDMFQADPELPGIIVHGFVTTLAKTPGHAPADALAAAPNLNQLQRGGGAVRQQLLGSSLARSSGALVAGSRRGHYRRGLSARVRHQNGN